MLTSQLDSQIEVVLRHRETGKMIAAPISASFVASFFGMDELELWLALSQADRDIEPAERRKGQ